MSDIDGHAVAASLPDTVSVVFNHRWHGRVGSGDDRERIEHFEGDEVELPRALAARLRGKGIVECDRPLSVAEAIEMRENPTEPEETDTEADTEDKAMRPDTSGPVYETKSQDEAEGEDEVDAESDD